MFLKLDGTFVVQLINFAIFFALLSVVFLRPVSRAIKERRAYINSVRTDYEKYQAEGNSLRAEAESIRAAARRQAEAEMSKARGEASNQAASVAVEYNAKAQSIVESAHATVTSELETARATEDAVVRDLANLMLERTVSER